MLQEERFYPAFKKSPLYIKCLAELDLLKDDSLDSRLGDDESIQIDSSPENSTMGVSIDILLTRVLYTSSVLPSWIY